MLCDAVPRDAAQTHKSRIPCHRPRRRAIQYPKVPVIESKGIGIPACAGYDTNENQNSSGQGSTIFQSSSPFLIFFISVVSPPLRRIQSFTVSG